MSANTPTDISTLLQGVVSRAATVLPADSGTVEAAQREQQRLQARLAGAAAGEHVLLLDCSGSMAESAGATTKMEVLRQALASSLGSGPAAPRLVAFASFPREIGSAAELPAPSGGTDLAGALAYITPHRPAHTLVISDGRPQDEGAALAAADRLTGRIDVIYVGPDDDQAAIAFMSRLARAGAGRVHVHDLRRHVTPRALAAAVRLALPAKGGKP